MRVLIWVRFFLSTEQRAIRWVFVFFSFFFLVFFFRFSSFLLSFLSLELAKKKQPKRKKKKSQIIIKEGKKVNFLQKGTEKKIKTKKTWEDGKTKNKKIKKKCLKNFSFFWKNSFWCSQYAPAFVPHIFPFFSEKFAF